YAENAPCLSRGRFRYCLTWNLPCWGAESSADRSAQQKISGGLARAEDQDEDRRQQKEERGRGNESIGIRENSLYFLQVCSHEGHNHRASQCDRHRTRAKS